MIKRIITKRLLICALVFHVAGCATSEPSLCGALPGTPQDIAATPRSDENLELLALRLSEGITADEAVYRRLVRDVAAIRAQASAVREIGYFAPSDGRTLHVAFDETRLSNVRAGRYNDWGCLNQHYGLAGISLSSGKEVSLTFKGRFNLGKLAKLYAALPGAKWSEPVLAIGSGPTIYVTPDGDTWHYVFDDASGDCLSGCSETHAYYFLVRDDLTPKFIARWDSTKGSSETAEPPEWVKEYLVATKRLWLRQSLP